MSIISNQNAEIPQSDNSGQIGTVKPVDRVDAQQSNQFSDLVKKDEQKAVEQSSAETEITPEELQRQIRENLFKNGFNRAMEKAKEIAKEIKDG